ncbi:uncharacterized protein LOC119660779 isoform X2 [Hermetia illucens]|uniref:uncharacterized protein LOC119660779 isoform X2 n=1 Tax=Hermetia illucens TaxID=343691 RepID=UPI0018CC0929|nr:uncharacterized protein LOC119660779 isoform X2 [Hermetia illucens]
MADKSSPSSSGDRINVMKTGEGPSGQEASKGDCLRGNCATASDAPEMDPLLDMEYCSKDMCTCFDHAGGEERALDAITFVPNAIVSCPNASGSNEESGTKDGMKPISRKIFLLKEYKEAIINLCYNKLDYSSRIDKLHIAWQCATILVGNSTAEACKNLLYWVLRHTLHLMLVGEWTTLPTEKRNEIRTNILQALPKIQNSPNSANRCEYILQHFDNPWGDKRLLTVLHGDARLLTKNDLDYLTAERGCMIVLRLQKLCETKCDDVAFTLCSKALLALRSVGENHELRKSTSIGHIYFIFDIYLCLVHKYIGVNKFIEEVKRLGLYDALLLIRRNINMDTESSRLFKFRAKVAKLSANITIATIMVDCLNSNNQHFYCAILKEWLKMHQKVPVRKFRVIARKLFSSACSQKHLHLACHIIKEMKVPEWRELLLELYVRVITGDLNELELLKSEKSCSVEVIIENEVTLSHRYLQIADLLQIHHPYLTHECILTAFSLNPTPENYNIVKCVALTKQWEAVENPDLGNAGSTLNSNNQSESHSTDSKVGSIIKTTISTTTTTTVTISNSLVTTTSTKTCQSNITASTKIPESTSNFTDKVTGNSEDSNSSSTLHVLHSITGSNKILENPSYDALAAPNLILDSIETIDLPDHIRIDLSVLLSSPRVKFLSWLQSWPELESNCQRLLKPGGKLEIVRQGLAIANDHLQYLNLDYDQFRNLPESDGPGIEKGYEIFADSDEEMSNAESDYEVSDDNTTRRKKPGRKPKHPRVKSPSLEKQPRHMNLQREYKRSYNKSMRDPLSDTLCSTFAQALQHDPKLISPFNDFLLRHLSQQSGESPPDSASELDALFRVFYIQQLQAQLQLSSSYTAALQQQVTPSHQGSAIRFKQRQSATPNQKDIRKRSSQVYTPSPIVPSTSQQHPLAPTSLARQQANARGFPNQLPLLSQKSLLNPTQKTMSYGSQLTITPSTQNMPSTSSLSRLNFAKRSYSQIATQEPGPSKIERSRLVEESLKRKPGENSTSTSELLHPQTGGTISKLTSIVQSSDSLPRSIPQKQPSGTGSNRVSTDDSNRFQSNVKQSGNQVRSSLAYVSAGVAAAPLTTTTTALPSTPKLALSTLLSSGRWVQQPASELKLSSNGKPTFVSTQSITAGNTNSGIIYPPIDPKKVFYVERIIPASKRSLLGSSVEIKDISKLTMRTATSSNESNIVISSGSAPISAELSTQKDVKLAPHVSPNVPAIVPGASTSKHDSYEPSISQPVGLDLFKASTSSSNLTGLIFDRHNQTKPNDLPVAVQTVTVQEPTVNQLVPKIVVDEIEISDSCSTTDSALTIEDMQPFEPKRSKLTSDPMLSDESACQVVFEDEVGQRQVGVDNCDSQDASSTLAADKVDDAHSSLENSGEIQVRQIEDILESDKSNDNHGEESKTCDSTQDEKKEKDRNEDELNADGKVTEENTKLYQVVSEADTSAEQPQTSLELNIPFSLVPQVSDSQTLQTSKADNQFLTVIKNSVVLEDDAFVTPPEGDSFGAIPETDPFMVAPEGDPFVAANEGEISVAAPGADSSVTAPEADSSVIAPEGDSFIADPEGDSSVADPEGDSFVADPEGDSFVADPEGDSFVADPEGDSFVADPEGDSFVADPEGDSFVADPEGDSFVADPEGDSFVVDPEGDSFVADPEGDSFVADPEGDSFVADPEGDSFVADPEGDSFVADPEGDSFVADPEEDSIVAGSATSENNEHTIEFPEGQNNVLQESEEKQDSDVNEDKLVVKTKSIPEEVERHTDEVLEDDEVVPISTSGVAPVVNLESLSDVDSIEVIDYVEDISTFPKEASCQDLDSPMDNTEHDSDSKCDSAGVSGAQINDIPGESMEDSSMPILEIAEATGQEETKTNANSFKHSTVPYLEPSSQSSTDDIEISSQNVGQEFTPEPVSSTSQAQKFNQIEDNASLMPPPLDPIVAVDSDTDTEMDDTDNDDVNPGSGKRTDHGGHTDTDTDSSESRDLVVQVPRRTYSRISGAGECSNLSPQNQSDQRSSSIQNNGSDQQRKQTGHQKKGSKGANLNFRQESNDTVSEGYLSDFECAAASTVDPNITNDASSSYSLCASILKDFATDSSDESELTVQIPTRTYGQLNSSSFIKRRSAFQQTTKALVSDKKNCDMFEEKGKPWIDSQERWQQRREKEKYESSSSEDEDDFGFGLSQSNCNCSHEKPLSLPQFAASTSSDQSHVKKEPKIIEPKQQTSAKRGVFEFYINTYPSGKSSYSNFSIPSKETDPGSSATPKTGGMKYHPQLRDVNLFTNNQTDLTKSTKGGQSTRVGSKLAKPNSGVPNSLCHTSKWVAEKFRRYQKSLKYSFKASPTDIKRMTSAKVVVQPLTNETLLKHNQTVKIDGCLVQLPKIQLKRLRTCHSPISFQCCCECAIKDVECRNGAQNDSVLYVPPNKKVKINGPPGRKDNSTFRPINVHSAMLLINPKRAIVRLPHIPLGLTSGSVPKNVQLAPNDFRLGFPMQAIIEVQEKLNETIYFERILFLYDYAVQIALSVIHGQVGSLVLSRFGSDFLQLPKKCGLEVVITNSRLTVKRPINFIIRRLPQDFFPAVLSPDHFPGARHFTVIEFGRETKPGYPKEFNWATYSVVLSIYFARGRLFIIFSSGIDIEDQPQYPAKQKIIRQVGCILSNDNKGTAVKINKINMGQMSDNVEAYSNPIRCW